MNNTLLKSVVSLVLFYGTAAFIWLNLLPPAELVKLLEGIPEFMRPKDIPKATSFTFLNMEPTQILFLKSWTVPVLQAWVLALVTGILLTVAVIFLLVRNRKLRKSPSGSWRSLSITLGPLPVPEQMPRSPMKIHLEGVPFSKHEKELLAEILGTLKAHPKAYVGAGHGTVTLHDHTMEVIRTIMKRDDCTPMHILAAAAHDMGKITSFIQSDDGSWERVKMHAQESARMLATLPAWGKLAIREREAIRLAVKNEHSPNMIPGIDSSVPPAEIDENVRISLSSDFRHPLYDNPEFRREVVALVNALRESDGVVTAAEKKVVLEEIKDLPQFCLDAFLKALPAMPFYYQGVPTGFKGMIWQTGKRLYISEAKMRDHVMSECLSDEHHAALGGNYRGPKTIAPFTWNLLEAFKAKGWLVTTAMCRTKHPGDGEPEPAVEMTCDPNMPLWDVLSGNKVLNGMIIIEIDDANVLMRTPQKKIGFPIGAHRPHQPSAHTQRQGQGQGQHQAKAKTKSGVKLLDASDIRPGAPETSGDVSVAALSAELLSGTEPKAKGGDKTKGKTEKPKAEAQAVAPKRQEPSIGEVQAETVTVESPVGVDRVEPVLERPPTPAELVAAEGNESPVAPPPVAEAIEPTATAVAAPEPGEDVATHTHPREVIESRPPPAKEQQRQSPPPSQKPPAQQAAKPKNDGNKPPQQGTPKPKGKPKTSDRKDDGENKLSYLDQL